MKRAYVGTQDGATLDLLCGKNWDFASWGVYPRVDVVASPGSFCDVREYVGTHIPPSSTGFQGDVRFVDPVYWGTLTSVVGSRDVMDYLLGTNHVEYAAMSTHNAWLAGKTSDLEDPHDPYRGYGDTRVKVRDLSLEQRRAMGIRDDADPSKDVFHPLHRPFVDLSPDVKNRNVVPMAAAVLAIGDFLTDDTTNSDELRDLIRSLSTDVSPATRQMLNMVTHVAWMAGDISAGGRPWHEGSEPNYHIYSRLREDVQELDTQASAAPIRYLHDLFVPISTATIELVKALQREGGPYEMWWAREFAVLKAADGWYTHSGVIPLSDKPKGVIPSFRDEAISSYRSQTNWRYDMDRFKNELGGCVDDALCRGHIVYDTSTNEWSITVEGRKRKDLLARISCIVGNPINAAGLETLLRDHDNMRHRYQEAA